MSSENGGTELRLSPKTSNQRLQIGAACLALAASMCNTLGGARL